MKKIILYFCGLRCQLPSRDRVIPVGLSWFNLFYLAIWFEQESQTEIFSSDGS